MQSGARAIRRKDITDLARQTWSRIWPDPMPAGWRVYLVRKTFIQELYGRAVCGVTLRHTTERSSSGAIRAITTFRTLVHELAHLRTLDEGIDHGPRWNHEFNGVARQAFGAELERNI